MNEGHRKEIAGRMRLSFLNDLTNKPYETCLTMMATLGEYRGVGTSRWVFDFLPIRNTVIKISLGCVSQNENENRIFDEVKGTSHAKWFNKVLWCSDDARILISPRAADYFTDAAPGRIPHYFSDLKPENFGWVDDKFVCIDYGLVLCGFTPSQKKLTKNKILTG